MNAFLMNLLIATFWFFLSSDKQLNDYLFGYAFGFGLMYLFRNVMDCKEYIRRTLAFFSFSLRFTLEYLKANLILAFMVLTRSNKRITPGFIRYAVKGMTPLEILILSQVISLTPGSTTVEVGSRFEKILVHLFDASDPENASKEITRSFRDPILAFTRSAEPGESPS